MSLRKLLCGPVPSVGVGGSLGLLLLRVSVGGMMLLGHGWGKLTSFAERSSSFPDPFGHRLVAEHGLGYRSRSVLRPSGDFGICHSLGCRAADGYHAGGRAYHTRGRPVGEKGIRPAVLFPLCHVVANGRGTLLARRLFSTRCALSPTECRATADRCRHRWAASPVAAAASGRRTGTRCLSKASRRGGALRGANSSPRR